MTPEQQARSLSPIADELRAEIERLGREECNHLAAFYCAACDSHAEKAASFDKDLAKDTRDDCLVALASYISWNDNPIAALAAAASASRHEDDATTAAALDAVVAAIKSASTP